MKKVVIAYQSVGERIIPYFEKECKREFTMSKEKILPTVIMIIQFASALPYAFKGDWRMALYWTAAGVLTIAVTY